MDRKEGISERSKDKAQRDADKLKRDIEKRVIAALDDILSISEVAIGDPQRYKAFRSKVLRSGNDAIRDVKRLLDVNYQVVFIPTNEDIIQVQSPAVYIKKN